MPVPMPSAQSSTPSASSATSSQSSAQTSTTSTSTQSGEYIPYSQRPKTEEELEAERRYEEAIEEEYAKREGGA